MKDDAPIDEKEEAQETPKSLLEKLPERMLVTSVGPQRIHQPRISEKWEGEAFTSAILPCCLLHVSSQIEERGFPL